MSVIFQVEKRWNFRQPIGVIPCKGGIQSAHQRQGGITMCAWIVPPKAGLIEPAIAPEFFIDGCGAVELIGSCVRFYLCAEQLPLEAASSGAQSIVLVKIVRPLAGIPDTIAQLAQCLTDHRGPDQRPGAPFRPRVVS
jgi:hypothetical protein